MRGCSIEKNILIILALPEEFFMLCFAVVSTFFNGGTFKEQIDLRLSD